MKIPIDWLKQYLKTNKSAQELGETLTMGALETEVSDDLLDIEVTPNRADCLSVLGVARELSALTEEKFVIPEFKLESNDKTTPVKLEVSEKDLVDPSLLILIKGIKIGPSPEWIVKHLEKIGARPINNIVDITNYVMVLTGQPLHAFDYEKLKSKNEKLKIMKIRRGKNGEKVTTLDGIERAVDQTTIVIEDEEHLIDLAGIMGGKNSEIDSGTSDIVLQASVFNPVLIRRTAKRLGLTTEASYRFERGVNPYETKKWLEYAASLVLELAGGEAFEILEYKESFDKLRTRTIEVSEKEIKRILGIDIPLPQAEKLLARLGFSGFTPPPWRADLKTSYDVIEEIGRIYGYEKLPRTPLSPTSPAIKNETFYKREALKDKLADLGLDETINTSFTAENSPFKIQNPTSSETRYLRNSLLPGLLKNVSKNPSFPDIGFFEIGTVFGEKEDQHLGIILTGKALSFSQEIEKLVGEKPQTPEKTLLEKLKIRRSKVVFWEMKLSEVLSRVDLPLEFKLPEGKIKIKETFKFPALRRDLAFIVDTQIESEKVEEAIKNVSPLVTGVELFDEFASEKFGKAKKNLAFHIYLSSPKRTLTKEEGEEIIRNIVAKIKKDLGGELRSF